jgi:hypothetical protein
MKKRMTAWRWWAKALGEKASKCDKESDNVAIIRSIIFSTYLITNCFIVAGVIRHWNDETKILVEIHNPETPVPDVRIKKTNHMNLNNIKMPDDNDLNIMWTVATSSSIESGTRPHLIFARLLYSSLTKETLRSGLYYDLQGKTQSFF